MSREALSLNGKETEEESKAAVLVAGGVVNLRAEKDEVEHAGIVSSVNRLTRKEPQRVSAS